MAAFPQCIPAAPCAYGTLGSEAIMKEQLLDLLRLKASMQEQLLQHQLAQSGALSQTGCERLRQLQPLLQKSKAIENQQVQVSPHGSTGKVSCVRPPPGLEVSCLASQATHLEEDDGSTMCSSQTRTCDSRSESSLSQPDNPQTTLMIRNVPVLYTRDMLASEWLNEGTFDFLYLPYCCSSQRNLSFAFLNFTSDAAALSFVQKWQKQRLAHFSSRKPLNISFADVQGLEPNLLELKKKRVNRVKAEQCQPLIFSNGRRVSMSEAFKALENTKQWTLQVGQSFSL